MTIQTCRAGHVMYLMMVHLFTGCKTIGKSICFGMLTLTVYFSDSSGSAKRQSTGRQAWESPSQSPALRGTPGTTRKVASKKALGTVLIRTHDGCIDVCGCSGPGSLFMLV